MVRLICWTRIALLSLVYNSSLVSCSYPSCSPSSGSAPVTLEPHDVGWLNTVCSSVYNKCFCFVDRAFNIYSTQVGHGPHLVSYTLYPPIDVEYP